MDVEVCGACGLPRAINGFRPDGLRGRKLCRNRSHDDTPSMVFSSDRVNELWAAAKTYHKSTRANRREAFAAWSKMLGGAR